MTFDEHAAKCPVCSRAFGLCAKGRRLLVEDVDALSRQSPLRKQRSSN